MITFDDFKKLDIRVGTIVEARRVEGSEKLLQIIVDIGSEKRQIIAGIGKAHEPEDLVGQQIPVLANLEPKTIMGLESQGMILAADEDGKPILLHPDKKIPNGSAIR